MQNGSFLSITLHNSVYNLSMNWPFTNVFSIIHSICTAVTSHQFFVKSSLHKFTECQQCVIQCVNLLLAIGNNNIWPYIIQTTEKDLNTSDHSEFFCYEPFVIMFPNLFSSTFTIFSTVFSVAAFRSFFSDQHAFGVPSVWHSGRLCQCGYLLLTCTLSLKAGFLHSSTLYGMYWADARTGWSTVFILPHKVSISSRRCCRMKHTRIYWHWRRVKKQCEIHVSL